MENSDLEQKTATEKRDRRDWDYPVKVRKVSDDFEAHKERKSLAPGVDYVAANGTKVFSISSGRVIAVDRNPDGPSGRFVTIDHGNGVISTYRHLSVVNVRTGIRVLARTQVGKVGGSGYGKENHYGPHLHLDIKSKGKFVDPEPFLKKRV